MTAGATFFEGATRRDPRGREITQTLDEVYREVRDGEDAAAVHGHILERFVRHVLLNRFPDRLGACEVQADGAALSGFRLDAGTSADPPCAGLEAKTSTRALKKRAGADRVKAKAKAAWVTSLLITTSGAIAGVWVTWVPEEHFRNALGELIGPDDAAEAVIVAHEQLRQLPTRMRALVTAMAKATTRPA